MARAFIALAGIMVLAVGAVRRPDPRQRTLLTAAGCPLTRSQELKAVEAFKQLLPVVQHPRCMNCHGGVDPFVAKEKGGHLAGAIDTTRGFIQRLKTCQECHSELPGWDLPPAEFFFVGKDATEICKQFKKFNPTPQGIVGHLDNDNGRGPQFTMTAFKGDRALNDMAKDMSTEETHRRFMNQPPPISHAEFVARVKAWMAAMGDGYVVKPDCGCKPSGSAWVGTVKTVFVMRTPDFGTLTETANATVRFVIDSSYDTTDDPAVYWKSVSGTLNWTSSNTGGKCRVSGSGSFPINRGADDNPLANLREESEDAGGLKFSMGLGPWPDAYEPHVSIRCPENTLIAPLYGAYYWWNYDIAAGLLSPDSKTLKGSFHGGGVAEQSWEWDLHLEP